jgi:hypothetical protein
MHYVGKIRSSWILKQVVRSLMCFKGLTLISNPRPKLSCRHLSTFSSSDNITGRLSFPKCAFLYNISKNIRRKVDLLIMKPTLLGGRSRTKLSAHSPVILTQTLHVFPQANTAILPSIRPWPLPSAPFQIHDFLIVLRSYIIWESERVFKVN